MKRIFDTHAHLDHLKHLDQALESADQAGVEGIVAVSMDLASCQKNLEIKQSRKKPKIYLAMGMHPEKANDHEADQCIALIQSQVSHLHAIGEIGLDFWYKWVRKDQEKKDEQRKVYRRFLELAKELDLPAIIHSRGVWKECLETARDIGVKKAEFHWYSGPVDVLDEIIACGYYISAAPSLAYSPPSREAILHAPIEKILIETDSPVYFRHAGQGDPGSAEEGFQAEPKDVFKTLEAYCALKNMEEQKALDIFNQNAREFFGLQDK